MDPYTAYEPAPAESRSGPAVISAFLHLQPLPGHLACWGNQLRALAGGKLSKASEFSLMSSPAVSLTRTGGTSMKGAPAMSSHRPSAQGAPPAWQRVPSRPTKIGDLRGDRFSDSSPVKPSRLLAFDLRVSGFRLCPFSSV